MQIIIQGERRKKIAHTTGTVSRKIWCTEIVCITWDSDCSRLLLLNKIGGNIYPSQPSQFRVPHGWHFSSLLLEGASWFTDSRPAVCIYCTEVCLFLNSYVTGFKHLEKYKGMDLYSKGEVSKVSREHPFHHHEVAYMLGLKHSWLSTCTS